MQPTRRGRLAAAVLAAGLLGALPAAANADTETVQITLSDGGTCVYSLTAGSANLTTVANGGHVSCDFGTAYVGPLEIGLSRPTISPAVTVTNTSYGSGQYSGGNAVSSGYQMYCEGTRSCSRTDTTTVVPADPDGLNVSQEFEILFDSNNPVTIAQVYSPQADSCALYSYGRIANKDLVCTITTSTTDPSVILRRLMP